MDFYGNTLGFPLAIDRGWYKVQRVAQTGHWGLVDGNRGSHQASQTKPMMLALRVEIDIQSVPKQAAQPVLENLCGVNK